MKRWKERLVALALIALSNVLPGGASYDARNDVLAHAEFCREDGLDCQAKIVSPPNFADMILCEFGHSVCLPPSVSSFGDHVVSVIAVRAKEKMNRIDALAIVTVVANAHAGRNRPDHQFVGSPMGTSWRVSKSPVSVPIQTAAPQNATGRCFFTDVTKEPVNQWCAFGCVRTFLRAALVPTNSDSVGHTKERIAALQTDEWNRRLSFETMARHAESLRKVQCEGAACANTTALLF